MKAFDILADQKTIIIEQHFKKTDILVEEVCKGLDKKQKQIVEGIYNDLRPLIEATLTPDQINKIFTDVEAGATAAGGNRTLIGQGKDTVNKANEIINKIGKWLQDTKPVQAFDQKFEDLKNKVAQKFPDLADKTAVLGDWVKKNPGKSAAVIGILTAIASLAGGPVGGAIAGQVLRGAQELLKGEKLSTAIGKGLKTAAMGYLAGKSFELIGDAVAKGAELVKSTIPGAEKLTMMMDSTGLGFNAIEVTGRSEDLKPIKAAWNAAGQAWDQGDLGKAAKLIMQAKEQAAALAQPEYIAQLAQDAETRKAIMASAKQAIAIIDGAGAAAQGAVAGATAFDKSGKPVNKESIDLSSAQINTIFEWCDGSPSRIITEGPMDYLRKVGKNITTKVTADKLNRAWQKAGSPTDSDAVAKVLRDAGVSDEVIAPIFKSMKIKLAPAGQADQTAAGDNQNPAAGTQTTGAGQMDFKSLQVAVAQLRARDAQSLLKFIDSIDQPQKQAAPVAPKTAPAAPAQAATPAAPAPTPAPVKPSNVKITGKRQPAAKPKIAVAV